MGAASPFSAGSHSASTGSGGSRRRQPPLTRSTTAKRSCSGTMSSARLSGLGDRWSRLATHRRRDRARLVATRAGHPGAVRLSPAPVPVRPVRAAGAAAGADCTPMSRFRRSARVRCLPDAPRIRCSHSLRPAAPPSGSFSPRSVTHAAGRCRTGGAQSLANALADHFRSLGGEITTGTSIERHDQLPEAQHLLFDTSPRAMAGIMGDRFPAAFSRQLRDYPYGPGAFKVDWALSGPIPWKARECLEAATVHVGGSLEEIAAAESAPWKGSCAERPFVLVTQPSLFDATPRAGREAHRVGVLPRA